MPTRRSRRSGSLRVVASALAVAALGACSGSDTTSSTASSVARVDTTIAAESTVDDTTTTAGSTTTVPEWDVSSLPGRIAVVTSGCDDEMAGIADGNFVVCLLDPDGGNVQLVSDPAQSASWINFTWDGTTLLFDTEDSAYSVRVDGSGLVERDPYAMPATGQSPDGQWRLGTRWGEAGFWLRPASATDDDPQWRRLTSGSDDCCERGTWSPDSTRVAYNVSHGGDGCAELWVASLDGAAPIQIVGPSSTHDGAQVCPDLDSARWSPDGTQILFIDQSGDFQSSWPMIVASDGTNLHPLVSDASRLPSGAWIDCAVWSPDGTAVAMMLVHDMGGGLYIVSADGVHISELTGLPVSLTIALEMEWAPGW